MFKDVPFTTRDLTRAAVIAASVAAATHSHAITLDAQSYRTVVLRGDPAPGTLNGEVFDSIDYRVINQAGEVAFRARISGGGVGLPDNLGIWAESGATLGLARRSGTAAPGYASATFTNYDDPAILIDSAGGVGFVAEVTGTAGGLPIGSGNDGGIWTQRTGPLAAAATTQDAAPGTTGPMYFNGLSFPRMNPAGEVAFAGTLGDTPFTTTVFSSGLWVQQGASINAVALKDDPIPGGSGVTYNSFSLGGFNAGGEVAFASNLSGLPATNYGVFAGTPGSLRTVILRGDSAPGLPGVVFGDSSVSPVPSINDAGQVAFASSLAGAGVTGSNSHALWSEGQGSLALVARSGDAAPGTAQTFSRFEKPVINTNGDIAFRAGTSGGDGIWTHDGTTVELIAREGAQAPDAPAGMLYTNLFDPAMNANGVVAFRADTAGNASFGSGIWARDLQGNVISLVQTGELFDVDDDPITQDLREVFTVDLLSSSGGEDGSPSQINDLNQVALRLGFTDGSSGIFVATVPEPTSLALLAIGGAVLTRRRRCAS